MLEEGVKRERLRGGTRHLINLDIGSDMHAFFKDYAHRHGSSMTKLLVDHIRYLAMREKSEHDAIEVLKKDVIEGDVFLLKKNGNDIVLQKIADIGPSPVPDPNPNFLMPKRRIGRPPTKKNPTHATLQPGQFNPSEKATAESPAGPRGFECPIGPQGKEGQSGETDSSVTE